MRLIGAALITAAGAMAGLEWVRRTRERAELLEQLCRMLETMEFELDRFHTPMPALFERLRGQATGRTGRFCAAVSEGLAHLGQRDMAQIWDQALALLPRQAGEMLRPLGPVLGRYGAEEQVSAAAGCRRAGTCRGACPAGSGGAEPDGGGTGRGGRGGGGGAAAVTKDGDMDVDLIFKIAAVGILVAVLNLLLTRSGREEQALMTTIAGLVVVLVILVQRIAELFQLIRQLFELG